MKNYVKPTISDVELRPEEGLACFHSEGSGCSCGTPGAYPDINLGSIIQNIDWDYVIGLISGWLKKWKC